MELSSHPTVRRIREKGDRTAPSVDAADLRALCLDAGADDVRFVGLDRPEVSDPLRAVLPLMTRSRSQRRRITIQDERSSSPTHSSFQESP